MFSSENFFNGLTLGFITAFLLEKTNGDNLLTAYNSSLIALGGIIGGIITVRIAHLIHKPFQTILIGFLIVGFIGRICTGLAESIVVIGFFLMIRNILMPIINSSCELIWQKNTPKEYQGRVFGARRFFAQGSIPLSILIGTWALETIFPINGYLISLLSETIDQNIKTLQLSLFFIFCGFLETLIPLYYFIKTIINKILLRVR